MLRNEDPVLEQKRRYWIVAQRQVPGLRWIEPGWCLSCRPWNREPWFVLIHSKSPNELKAGRMFHWTWHQRVHLPTVECRPIIIIFSVNTGTKQSHPVSDAHQGVRHCFISFSYFILFQISASLRRFSVSGMRGTACGVFQATPQALSLALNTGIGLGTSHSVIWHCWRHCPSGHNGVSEYKWSMTIKDFLHKWS